MATIEDFELKIQSLKKELHNSNYNVLSELYYIFDEKIEPYTLENHAIALSFLHLGLTHKDPECLTIKEQIDKQQLKAMKQFFIDEKIREEQNIIDIKNQKQALYEFEEKELLKRVINYFNNSEIYEKLIKYAHEKQFSWLNFILFMKQLQFEKEISNLSSKGFIFNKKTYKDLSLSLKNPSKHTTNNLFLSVFDNNDNCIFKSSRFVIEPSHNDEIIQVKNVLFDYDISKIVIVIRNTEKLYNLKNVEFTYLL